MPISLAASSQTQIGSTPFSNFCQRLSQSIIGTKQLNVEGRDSGPPFLSHTRKRAGCSPSLVQEVGLRIASLYWQGPCSAPSVPVGVRPRRIPANGDSGNRVRERLLWRSLSENGAQLGFQRFVKIALELANGISAINAIWIPNIRNPVDNCPKGVYRINNGLGAGRQKKCGRMHGTQYSLDVDLAVTVVKEPGQFCQRRGAP